MVLKATGSKNKRYRKQLVSEAYGTKGKCHWRQMVPKANSTKSKWYQSQMTPKAISTKSKWHLNFCLKIVIFYLSQLIQKFDLILLEYFIQNC